MYIFIVPIAPNQHKNTTTFVLIKSWKWRFIIIDLFLFYFVLTVISLQLIQVHLQQEPSMRNIFKGERIERERGREGEGERDNAETQYI